MKKTALATVLIAASGAVMAEATITGTVSLGYQQSTVNNGPTTAATAGALLGGTYDPTRATAADASGLGVDTAELNFNVSEDLGGGQKVVALMGFDTVSRGGVVGGDLKLTYTNNSIGQFQLGSAKDKDEMSGIPSAGAPVIDMDGKLNQIRTNSDYFTYTVPVGPVYLQYKLSEGSKGLGLGNGSQGLSGSTVGQRSTTLSMAYLKDALQVVAAYVSYDNRNATTIATTESLTKDNAVHFEAGYDFNVAKVGFGFTNVKASVGPSITNALVGVSIPAGAWLFGATFENATTSGISDAAVTAFPASAPLTQANLKTIMSNADGTATGYSLGAQYNLSKRSNITIKYANWVRSGYEQFEAFGTDGLGAFGYKARNSLTSILLNHSF